jgi:hypothetical protein
MLRALVCLTAGSLMMVACSRDHRSADGFCKQLSAAQAAFTNGQTDAASVAKQFHRLGSSAPDAIRGSWTELTSLFDDLVPVNAKDDKARDSGFKRALTPPVQAAAAEVTSYVKTTCRFDLNVPAITGGAAPTPP